MRFGLNTFVPWPQHSSLPLLGIGSGENGWEEALIAHW